LRVTGWNIVYISHVLMRAKCLSHPCNCVIIYLQGLEVSDDGVT
jgi:hypothetical protein